MIINGLIDDGTKMILLYTSSDGTRGSQSNPYRLEDIYDTCVDNNWDYVEKLSNTYLIKYQLDIGNRFTNETHFKIDDENVELINNSGANQDWYWYENKYFNNCRITGINDFSGNYSIRLIFYGDENIFNNVYFNTFNTITITNGNYIINNMYWNRIANSYIPSGNSVNLTIDNFLATNGSYGFIPMVDFTYATNLGSDNCTRGILAGYASWTINNFFIKNCTYDLTILINGPDRFDTLINPKIDLSKTYLFNDNGLHTTTNCNGWVDVKSTFKLLIDDCDYIIKDNYGNEYSGNTSDTNELDITYWRYEGKRNGDDVYYQVLDQYQPFTIELKKDGYETNIINDVYITNGEPTIIRATLKEKITYENLVPMNVGKIIYNLLSSNELLNNSVNGIYPILAPENTSFPYIVYNRRTTPEYTKDGYCGNNTIVDINIYSDKYDESIEISEKVDEIINGYNGNMLGHNVDYILLDNVSEDYNNSYIQKLTYSIKV